MDVGIIRPLVAEAQLLGHCRQRGNLGRRRRGIQTVRKDDVWFHAMRIPAVDGRSVVAANGSIRAMPIDLPANSNPLIEPWPLPWEQRLEQRPLSAIDLVVIHCTELPDLASSEERLAGDEGGGT